jgi:hypothetical protein
MTETVPGEFEMERTRKARVGAFLFFALAVASAFGQAKNSTTSAVPSRITAAVDEHKLVTLKGNTHPMARSANDKGQVESQFRMERMQLVLKRGPEQQAALEKFNAEQNDPASPNFHHWLHADEIGKLYGPSDSDIAAITSWLQSQGFSVDAISKGRVTIEFSGTAGQVQQAFHTQMRRYIVNGEMHLANDRDPAIPEALAQVVTGISSLHDFFPQSQSRLGRFVTKNHETGKIAPVAHTSSQAVHSQYSFGDPNAGYAQGEDIGPYDFAAMYNLLPLWNSGITGKNQSIAIAAASDITLADISTFRTFFGLSKFSGTTSIVHNGPDPGFNQGNQVENTLDAEWAGASAPDANVVVVVSKSTASTSAINLSMSYIVDNEVAPIMSTSYGECEAYLGSAGNLALNAIFLQGSTEGISLFSSAGDQGSTGCDSDSSTQPPYVAESGLQVNGFASSPYITGVGGTDLLWQDKPTSTYWGANDSNNASALGHIPEIPWNGTCSSTYLLTVFTGEGTPEKLCNDALNSSSYYYLVSIAAGSGGASSCIGGTGTLASCTGAYAKPSWQTGTGVPADNVRNVPDVSLFASSGFPDGIIGSAYLFCVSSGSPDKSCDYTGNNVVFQEVGGTSVSSPAMAGIMALVLQKTGSHQGLANPMFYQLASTQTPANCNGSTASVGSGCIFYDVTSGSIAMPCLVASPNCVVTTAGDQIGISAGYSAAAGYDLATGLGSVNAYNLVNAWPTTTAPPTTTASVSPGTYDFPSAVVNTTSPTPETITITNTGTTAISFTGISITGANASSFSDTTTCSLTSTLAPSGMCTVAVSFAPTVSGTLSATLNIVDTAGTQTVSLSGTGASAPTYTLNISPANVAFNSTVINTAAATQPVTVTNTGTATVTLGTISITGANASSFSETTPCGTTLASGSSCMITVGFTPTTTGTLAATLSIPSNATGSPQTVSLTGTGATAPTYTLIVTPPNVAFTSTTVGTSASAQPVTLKNTGTAIITLGTISIAGANASSFSETTPCGTTLASGSSCMITVGFTPTTTGTLAATLSIPSNATGSPQTVSLTGTGAAAPLLSTTTTLVASPASVAPGANVLLTATVSASSSTQGGTVTFYSGSSSLGTGTLNGSGVATLTTTFANAGTYSLTAAYAANATFAGSSSTPFTETVTAATGATAGVTAAFTPSSVIVPQGQSGTLTLTLTPIGGYTGTVTLACGTLPQYMSCVFAPSSLNISATTATVTDTFTLNTSASSVAAVQRNTGIYSAELLWLPGSLLALLGFSRRKRLTLSTRLLSMAGLLCVGLATLGALSGCSSSPSSANSARVTPAGTYSVPVVLTLSGGGTQTVSATVFVQ